jgi:hypothetical protein
MKKAITFYWCVLMGVLIFSCTTKHENAITTIRLADHWFIKSSLEVQVPDSIVSTREFIPDAWFPTSVPTTVLNALIKNKVYPDPRFGMNNFLIPDVSDTFNTRHDLAKFSYLKNKANPWKDPYWYRTEFSVPVEWKGKELWLHFDGINYRADVWINGHQVADKQEMAGMFLRFKFNITEFAKPGRSNYLAVKIYQVDHPGTPDPGTQFKVFGHNRGHAWEIFRDETLKFTGGWDCAPVIRDRNMGIYQQVFLTATGPVSIDDPYVITDLPLPDTSKADLTISCSLSNAGTSDITGEITGTIDLINTLEFPTYKKDLGGSMPQIVVKKEVKIKAGETTTFELSSTEFPQLLIQKPYLWWPNGYGKQYLHNLKLTFTINHAVSDSKDVTFGIREVTNEIKKIGKEYGRIFYVNGRRIFCRGGWIQPDMLLEMNTKRLYDEARLCAEAHVNMLGNEDAPSPAGEIMETYDKYGLMVWETFFQCYRTYPGTASANNPDDHELAKREVADIVKRYRNNPSLVIWCLENEATVCEELYSPLRKNIINLDSTRPFIPCTSYDWDVDKLTPYIKGDLPLGTTDDGDPDYCWNPDSYYFDKILEVNKQTFRNELGSPSMPVYSSLRKFIPTLEGQKSNPIFPLDSIWAEHGAWDDNGYAYKAYDNAIRKIYGASDNAEEYVKKAQYVNANSYRAMFEAANHRMWDITSGVMIWKLNSCWPDVCWQIYDWYLNPNASYYFLQKALEPVHIQMNANSRVVSVINTTMKPLSNVVIKAQLIDFNMKVKWSGTDTVNVETDRYEEILSVPSVSVLTPVYFVKLELINLNGGIISENLYWLSSKNPANMTDLGKLEPAPLKIAVSYQETEKEYHISVKLRNASNKLSFFNRLMITRGEKGEEVLPTFWSTNFVTLFPDEGKTVTCILAKEDLLGTRPYVCIENSKVDPVGIINH